MDVKREVAESVYGTVPQHLSNKVTHGSEGGNGESTYPGNSLVAHPTFMHGFVDQQVTALLSLTPLLVIGLP